MNLPRDGSREYRPISRHASCWQILLRVAARFQLYLKQIDRLSLATETQLHRSMQNKELFQLLGLEKSLVYFSTSLKSNELTLEKILPGPDYQAL